MHQHGCNRGTMVGQENILLPFVRQIGKNILVILFNGKMVLLEIGEIANDLWLEIPNHAKYVKLGQFIVMPNHVHGIINLMNNTDNFVETRHTLSLQLPQKTIGQKRFQNQGANTISSIIGSYKSAVTKKAHKLGLEFKWQSRFYDHIIRNEQSYQNICNYIINNPLNWGDDEYNNEI